MENVLSFPKKSSVLSRAATDMVQWFKDQGAPHMLADLFANLADDRFREILPDNILDHVAYEFSVSGENIKRMSLKSNLRKNLFPEFGTKGYQDFFTIAILNPPQGLEPVPFPQDLKQDLSKYFNSYAETRNSNLIAFCYALIEAILEDSKFRYITMETDDDDPMSDNFVFGLTDESGVPFYVVIIDFLPILLDNSALTFWEEKIETKD